MGKRSDRLTAEILDLKQRIVNFQNANTRREVERKRLISEIMKEMIEKDFTIVTASGKVITGRATEARGHAEPVNVGSNAGYAWSTFIPGPTTYSAQITLKPKH